MKKLVLLVFVLLTITGCTNSATNEVRTVSQTSSTQIIDTPSTITQPIQETPVEFNARFEIYTRGTKRIFTEAKYHNQSEDVYISLPDPHQITIKKAGVTWNDFFSTLPFSLKKDCLVTGTKQTFCTNEKESLRFILNDVETPNALDLPVQPNDFLKVEYGP